MNSGIPCVPMIPAFVVFSLLAGAAITISGYSLSPQYSPQCVRAGGY